jgi:hypothetical protein
MIAFVRRGSSCLGLLPKYLSPFTIMSRLNLGSASASQEALAHVCQPGGLLA